MQLLILVNLITDANEEANTNADTSANSQANAYSDNDAGGVATALLFFAKAHLKRKTTT